MKRERIYPKEWLEIHPYTATDGIDLYYTELANRLYGECRTAGIKALMITGDHMETACAIARELDILRDGDLVKFAKATPPAEENEADYLKAYYFVEETKLAEESTPTEGPDTMDN